MAQAAGAPSAIGFQSLEFSHRLAWCTSPLEGLSRRWIPVGMPRLNPNLENAVFFLYRRDPRSGEIDGPWGTGVFVALPSKRGRGYLRHCYAVSCWHVALHTGASILRVNTKDGSRYIECEPEEWQFFPDGSDLAAVDITERRQAIDLSTFIPRNLFATPEFISHDQVGIGEDGFMLGLFVNHPGEHRNIVAGRFGNVSVLAHSDAPIEQPNGQMRPSHIFDMRSRPGFSGSPVFIYRTPASDFRMTSERGDDAKFASMLRRHASRITEMEQEFETRQNTFLMLLGVHAGQYPELVEARKVRKAPRAESDDVVRDRDKIKLPSSMAVVVPAWDIIPLLDKSVFAEQRERRELADQAQNDHKPVPEAIERSSPKSAESTEPTSEPGHRERFTSLLNEAAKKKPPAD